MNVLFDHASLLKLVSSLYVLTGIRANILDPSGCDICLSTEHAPFCTLMNATRWGHNRCMACDRQAVQQSSSKTGFYFYRCHAGACEAVLPLRSAPGTTPLAYLMFGQFLDTTPLEQQWEQTRKELSWYPGDLEELRQAFFQFRQYTREELVAYAEILEALASHIVMKGMVLSTALTDLQRLELYLDQHYMEKLSLESISKELRIGRTKLCSLAKELSGGQTLSSVIAQRRVDAAKTLLMQSDLPISAVAEAVGISDYNYFTKIFRSVSGTTPSAFRKQVRQIAHTGHLRSPAPVPL